MARPTRTGGKTSLARKRKASPPKRRRPGKAKHRAAPAAKPPSVAAEPGRPNNHSSELKEAREQQAATAAILKVIARSPDNVQPVFEAIAASANGLLGGYSTSVLRFIDGVTHLAAFTPTSPEADEILKATFPVPSSEIPFVARLATGATVQITDTETDVNPRSARLRRARGYRSILLAPLMSAGTAIGFIGVSRREAGPFADHHVNLLQTFADQAVIAIENASLLEQVQAKTRDLQEALEQQTATAEVLSVISSSAGDLVPVFDTMLGKAMQLCSADFGVLNTYDGKAFHTAATYALPPAYDEFRRGHPLEYGPGTAPARLLQGEPVVELTDLLESEAYRNGEPNRRALVDVGGARCLVAVPLLKDERVVGNVMIFRQEKGRFSEKAGEGAVLGETSPAAPAVCCASCDRDREHEAASGTARKHC